MSGVYTVPLDHTVVGINSGVDGIDLCELVAGAAQPLILLAVHLGQITELGDAQEEQLVVRFRSGHTNSGAGGSSVTPGNTDTGSAETAVFTAEAFNPQKASGGTIINHYPWTWNIRGPFDIILPESMQIIIAAGRRCVLDIASPLLDAMTIGGHLVVQEIG